VTAEVAWFDGAHSELRPFFELAEDSAEQLDAYIELGQILVARRGELIVGHLQLIAAERIDTLEIKSLAVIPEEQGRGIGRLLVDHAAMASANDGVKTLLVSTAAASSGNLRFYQRLGFRMLSVDRDAFTPATGYPDPIYIEGIPLRDRVWLSRDL
jgi:GNAT superfamily N-acetyltransferase